MPPEGTTIRKSNLAAKETMDRLAAAVKARGMTVLARFDHAAAAADVGMTLRPTEVALFGNPAAGTPLMQAVQTMGLDLPLRALVWRDEKNETWIGYNDPTWLARRHGVEAGAERVLAAMTAALAAVAEEAARASD